MRRASKFVLAATVLLGMTPGCAYFKGADQFVFEARTFESQGNYVEANNARKQADEKGFASQRDINDNLLQMGLNSILLERYDRALQVFEKNSDSRGVGRVYFEKGDLGKAREELQVFVHALMINYNPRGDTPYDLGYRSEIYHWFNASMRIRKANPLKLMSPLKEDRYLLKEARWKWVKGSRKKSKKEFRVAIEILFDEALEIVRSNKPFHIPKVFEDLIRANPRIPPKYEHAAKYVILRLWDQEADVDRQVKLLTAFLKKTGQVEDAAESNPYIRNGVDTEGMEEEDALRMKRKLLVDPTVLFLLDTLGIRIY